MLNWELSPKNQNCIHTAKWISINPGEVYIAWRTHCQTQDYSTAHRVWRKIWKTLKSWGESFLYTAKLVWNRLQTIHWINLRCCQKCNSHNSSTTNIHVSTSLNRVSVRSGLGHRQTRETLFCRPKWYSEYAKLIQSVSCNVGFFWLSIFFRFGWMQQLRFFSPWDQVLGSCWLMPATTNSTTTATSEFYLIL